MTRKQTMLTSHKLNYNKATKLNETLNYFLYNKCARSAYPLKVSSIPTQRTHKPHQTWSSFYVIRFCFPITALRDEAEEDTLHRTVLMERRAQRNNPSFTRLNLKVACIKIIQRRCAAATRKQLVHNIFFYHHHIKKFAAYTLRVLCINISYIMLLFVNKYARVNIVKLRTLFLSFKVYSGARA